MVIVLGWLRVKFWFLPFPCRFSCTLWHTCAHILTLSHTLPHINTHSRILPHTPAHSRTWWCWCPILTGEWQKPNFPTLNIPCNKSYVFCHAPIYMRASAHAGACTRAGVCVEINRRMTKTNFTFPTSLIIILRLEVHSLLWPHSSLFTLILWQHDSGCACLLVSMLVLPQW